MEKHCTFISYYGFFLKKIGFKKMLFGEICSSPFLLSIFSSSGFLFLIIGSLLSRGFVIVIGVFRGFSPIFFGFTLKNILVFKRIKLLDFFL